MITDLGLIFSRNFKLYNYINLQGRVTGLTDWQLFIFLILKRHPQDA